jgi:hypothetical protein
MIPSGRQRIEELLNAIAILIVLGGSICRVYDTHCKIPTNNTEGS